MLRRGFATFPTVGSVYSVCTGDCQFSHEGRFSIPLRIQSGDTLILPQCRAHRLRDSERTKWSHSNHVSCFDGIHATGNVRTDEEDRQNLTKIVVCRFPRPNKETKLLLHVLPETLICTQQDVESSAGIKSTIEVLEQEITRSSTSPGVIEHLAKALILQASRACNQRVPILRTASQATTTDRPVTRALELMRSRFEIAWTVASLATAVGVSRSTFAARFVEQVRMTPLNYLRQERMQQAAELLGDGSLGIKEVAMLVGYTSESAFNNAFKQWFGTTPGLFRRDRQR